MSEIKLNTFPNSKVEALSMLYLENQDLKDLTPEQLVDKYLVVHQKIDKRFRENRKSSVSVLR